MLLRYIPVVLALIVSMTGCVANSNNTGPSPLKPDADTSVKYTDAQVYQDLLAATKASQGNLDMLTKIKQGSAKWPANLNTVEPPPNSLLSKKITLTWYGPIESVVHVLASSVQYKVNIVGKAPAQPVMVSMDAVDEDVYKVIENIGWQTGDDVALIRDDRRHEIKLIYKES